MIVEAQLLNKVLQDHSMEILTKNGITREMFLVERVKADFIFDHYTQYRAVPDITTFCGQFADFEVFAVTESEQYMVNKIREASLYAKVVPIVKKMADKVREDSFEAIEYIKGEVGALMREVVQARGQGFDIIGNSRERLAEFERISNAHGLLGITTGIDELDRLLNGWVSEDLVVIFARTNEGKSWLLLYFLTVAWRYGYKVVLYSGEMSSTLVGFRFDTINKHFSNRGLMGGQAELGDVANDEVGHRTVREYRDYIQELQTISTSFIVLTPKDFGGKRPTVDELKYMVELYGADILGVDQISLMRDQRNHREKRDRYSSIAEDLFILSEDLQIPVLAASQANREAVKNKKKDNETPELHEISDSDGVAQNATRAISLKVVDKVLRIGIKKNRYGLNNKDVLMMWDINLGIMKQVLDPAAAEQAQAEYGF